MRISKIFATAGKHGTVAVEATFACLCGMGILIIRKCVVIPVKEDTRVELTERGYTMEEINVAERSAMGFIEKVAVLLARHGDGGHLQEPKESEIIDTSQDEFQPQASTP